MDPLTHEELEEFEARVKEVERALKEDFEYFHLDPKQVLRVVAAARVSIPRPIAEAPKDGTVVDMFYADGERLPDVRWFNDVEQSHWQYMDSVDGGWRKSYSHAKFVSFLPIPKGGAS